MRRMIPQNKIEVLDRFNINDSDIVVNDADDNPIATLGSDKIQLGSTYVLNDYSVVGTVEDENEIEYNNCTLKITGIVRQNIVIGPDLYLVAPLNAEQVTALDTNQPATLIFYFNDESNDIWGEFTAIPEYDIVIGNNKYVWDADKEMYALAGTWSSIAVLHNPVIRIQQHTTTNFATIANV